MISKPRKLARNVLAGIAAVEAVLAALAYISGSNALLLVVLAAAFAYAAARTKYKYVKTVEASGYKLV